MVHVKPATGLEGNPYFTGEIFSDKHPYFSYVASHIPNLGVLYCQDEVVYLDKVEKGLKCKVQALAQKEFDTINKSFLPYLNKAGYKDIKFLPTIERHEIELRKRYFGKYWKVNKCADVENKGIFIELKNVEDVGKKTRRNIISQIGDAAKKADIVILKSGKELDFKNIATTEFKKYTNLKRIVFFFNDNMFDFVP